MGDDQNPEIDEDKNEEIDDDKGSEGNDEDFIDPESDYYDSELGQMGETADESEMSIFQKKIFQQREKRLSKKLDDILRKAPGRFYPHFTFLEKRTINEAKAHKNLREKLMIISMRMNMARLQKHQQFISSLSPLVSMLPYVLIGVVVVIAMATVIALIMGEINANGDKTNGNSGGAAPLGPKGADFYAVRAVYTDDEQAEIDQVGDYIDILKGVKEQIDMDISGLEITFNLNLPEDDEINTFIENKNAGEFIIAYETMNEMADIVYKYDNESGSETELSNQLLAIKYFGYNADIINLDGENNDLTDIIKANLEQYKDTLFAPKEADGELPADLTDTINASVDTYMATVVDMRAEKYYIKDFVLNGDDATMEGIETKNYKAIIMYSKDGFDAQYMQFYAMNVDTEKFKAYIDDNGEKSEFDIVPADNNDIYNKTSMAGQDSQNEVKNKMYNYEIDHAFSIPSSAEPTYLNTIVEGKDILNLYDILIAQEDEISSSTILVEATDTEGNVVENVYSFKIGGYAIMTEYDSAFMFSINLEPKSPFLT